MKNKLFLIFISYSLVLFGGCAIMKERIYDVISLKPDNFAEEWVEDKIEDYTGLDIDLTSEDGR